MSQETMEWLNQYTLIGFTDKRGEAWHYREGSDNHYPDAIPVEDVQKRLFNWEPKQLPIYLNRGTFQKIPDRQAIVRSDTNEVLGIFSEDYVPHNYHEWLIKNVEAILDDGLAIGSAGLLKGGGQAWVSVEVPDTITTMAGVAYRPNLLAVTSLDGSLATTYKDVVTNVVCDNTMAAGLRETGFQYKVKHTRHSQMKVTKARDALSMLHKVSETFEDELKALLETEVTDKQFGQFLEAWKPTEGKEKAGLTRAISYHDALTQMWNNDTRVSPWKGTAWGVLQAVNTYTHHIGSIKGDNRVHRNMQLAVTGKFADQDQKVASALSKVLQLA